MADENTSPSAGAAPPERPAVIEWQTESSESSVKQVSPDGRWHLCTDVSRDGKPRMFLNNYDILCTPCGTGRHTAECWRSFVAACGSHLEKAAQVKKEAEAILAELEKQHGKQNS